MDRTSECPAERLTYSIRVNNRQPLPLPANTGSPRRPRNRYKEWQKKTLPIAVSVTICAADVTTPFTEILQYQRCYWREVPQILREA